MNAVFSFSSYPFGKLADRLNPLSLLSLGLVFLIASDIVLSVSGNASMVVLAVLLFRPAFGRDTRHIFNNRRSAS